jgi:hypothetical protein
MHVPATAHLRDKEDRDSVPNKVTKPAQEQGESGAMKVGVSRGNRSTNSIRPFSGRYVDNNRTPSTAIHGATPGLGADR